MGFSSVVLLDRAPSPRIDKEYRAALRALSPPVSSKVTSVHRGSLMSPTNGPDILRSPPESEAYYGETDSDADVAAQDRQRKQKRRSPSSSPAKALGRSSPYPDDISEMSGCESDISGYSQIQAWPIPNGTHEEIGLPQQKDLPGVARREVVYQPNGVEWSFQAEHSSKNMDQSISGAAEVDSGFQEPPLVPLVSPARAKEVLLRTSYTKLVPMVGPVDNPVDEELTMTYMDKAKEASEYLTHNTQLIYTCYTFRHCNWILAVSMSQPYPIHLVSFKVSLKYQCAPNEFLILPDQLTVSFLH